MPFTTLPRRFLATAPRLQVQARSFSVAATRFGPKDSKVATDQYPDSEHTTNKTDRLDVQNEQSGKGRDAKSRGEGGQATAEKDTREGSKRAKEEHPEAPDTAIGFQDERGGKGH